MADQAPDEAADLRRITAANARRLLPILFLGYLMNTLNKSNVGFASLEMSHQLGFTAAVFGLGAGLFFVPYAVFELPSNLLLRRFGARVWLPRILVSWGAVSMLTAATVGPQSFYLLRLLLGLAEAGWYAGALYYLTLWFPRAFRARAMMIMFLGAPISAVVGNPVSGLLVSMPPTLGLAGWQWLFLVEGLPSVVLGLVAMRVLRNTPADADWLAPADRTLLQRALDRERTAPSRPDGAPAVPRRRVVLRVAHLSAVNLLLAVGLYGTFIWAPSLIKDMGRFSNAQVGLVSAIPYLLSIVAAVWWARSSDRRDERRRHVVAATLLGAVGCVAVAYTGGPVLGVAFLALAVVGTTAATPVFYSLVAEALRDTGRLSLAAAIAVVTTVGNVGGFAGPYAVGLLVSATGGFRGSLLLIAASFAGAALLVAVARPASRSDGRAVAAVPAAGSPGGRP